MSIEDVIGQVWEKPPKPPRTEAEDAALNERLDQAYVTPENERRLIARMAFSEDPHEQAVIADELASMAARPRTRAISGADWDPKAVVGDIAGKSLKQEPGIFESIKPLAISWGKKAILGPGAIATDIAKAALPTEAISSAIRWTGSDTANMLEPEKPAKEAPLAKAELERMEIAEQPARATMTRRGGVRFAGVTPEFAEKDLPADWKERVKNFEDEPEAFARPAWYDLAKAVQKRDEPGQFMKGLESASLGGNRKNYARFAEGMGLIFGSNKLAEWGAKQAEKGEAQQKEERLKPRVSGFQEFFEGKERPSFSRLVDLLAYQSGSGIGSTLPTMAAGVGVAAATGNPILGFLGGAAGPSYAMNFGDVFDSALEDKDIKGLIESGALTKADVAKVAAAYAIPVAAFDLTSYAAMLGQVGRPAAVAAKENLKEAVKVAETSWLKQVAKAAATGVAVEPPTEGVQEVISQWARKTLGAGEDATKNFYDVLDNMAGAILPGLAFGGGAVAASTPLSAKARRDELIAQTFAQSEQGTYILPPKPEAIAAASVPRQPGTVTPEETVKVAGEPPVAQAPPAVPPIAPQAEQPPEQPETIQAKPETKAPEAETFTPTHMIDGVPVAPYEVGGEQGHVIEQNGEKILNLGPIEGGIPVWVDAAGKIFQGTAQPIQREEPAKEIAAPAREAIRSLQMQNRLRGSPASVEQMTQMVNGFNYLEGGGINSSSASGPPMVFGTDDRPIPGALYGRKGLVALDKYRIPVQYVVVEAGTIMASHSVDGTENKAYFADPQIGEVRALNNGRMAALNEIYRRGTADNYRAELTADAENLGIDPKAIEAMKAPILVRLYSNEWNVKIPNIGDLSQGKTLQRNPLEWALSDEAKLGEIPELSEEGELTPEYVKKFVQTVVPENERGQFLDAKSGAPNKFAFARAEAAIFQRAYGVRALTSMVAESKDPEIKSVLNALLAAAPKMARLEAASQVQKNELDLRPYVAEAAKAIYQAKSTVPKGTLAEKVTAFLRQQDIEGRHPWVTKLTEWMALHLRSPKRMGEGLGAMADFLYDEVLAGKEGEMFGARPVPSITDIIQAGDRYLEKLYGQNQAALNLAISPKIVAKTLKQKAGEPTGGEPPAQRGAREGQPAEGEGAEAGTPGGRGAVQAGGGREAPGPRPLKEIQVQTIAYEEDTGKRIPVKRNAEQALRVLDEDITKARILLECLKS